MLTKQREQKSSDEVNLKSSFIIMINSPFIDKGCFENLSGHRKSGAAYMDNINIILGYLFHH